MSEKTKEDNKNVFDGWEDPQDNFLDVLDDEKTDPATQEIINQALEDDPTEGKKSKEELDAEAKAEEERKKLEADTFEGWDDDETQEDTQTQTSEEEEEEEEEETTQATGPVATLNTLKEKGLLNFELEEGEELTDELAEEILQDSFEDSITSGVEERIKELPDVVKNLIKYSLNGGNPNQLIAEMVQQPTNQLGDDLDMEDEANQIKVMQAARKAAGDDQETADTYIQFLKDSGKLKGQADKAYAASKEQKKTLAKQRADQQAEAKQAAKLRERNFIKEIGATFEEEDFDVPLSRAEKKELPEYIGKATVKAKNGTNISQLQADIMEIFKDKRKTILLGKLVKSDFNMDDFTKEAKTETARKAQGAAQSGQNKKRRRSSQPEKNKSLADMLG